MFSVSVCAGALGAQTQLLRDAVEIDLDRTVFVQVGLFVLLMLVLKPLLFDPMLGLFEEREQQTEGTKAEARAMDQASAESLAQYEQAIEHARAEGAQLQEQYRLEGIKQQSVLLTHARDAASRTLEEQRQALQREQSQVRATLEAQTHTMAQQIVQSVLGQKG